MDYTAQSIGVLDEIMETFHERVNQCSEEIIINLKPFIHKIYQIFLWIVFKIQLQYVAICDQ